MKLLKLALEDHVKHRLTGVVVLIAIAVIFVPAMVKKSNQQLTEHVNVSVKLPPKPELPKVAVVQEQKVFEAVKVATLEMPSVMPPIPVTSTQAHSAQMVKKEVTLSKNIVKSVAQSETQVKKQTALASRDETYVVQLASFAEENNAKKLVARLKQKGYPATYHKQGGLFRVLVGHLARRDDARVLQRKLAESMQLKGFIVKGQVS